MYSIQRAAASCVGTIARKRDALRHRERQQKTHDSQQKGEKLKLKPESSAPHLCAAPVEAHTKPSPLAAKSAPATQPPANGPAHFAHSSGSGSCASASEARQGLNRLPLALASVPSVCAYEYGTLIQQQWANLCYTPVAQHTQQYSQWPPAAQSYSGFQGLSSSTT